MSGEEFKLISPGEVRVRIAPSPTGPLHIGTARTALFNYLFARKYQGSFILRIEDTDTERSKKIWEEEIIEGLKWLRIEWQEGPDNGGAYGPYRQSQRKEIYREYIKRLLDEDKLFFCFCTKDELEAHRQYLMSRGEPPRYSGKCRNLSKKEVEENLAQGKPYVLRFKNPNKTVKFKDLLRGEITTESHEFGDIVVARDESTPLYNLAAVIDDYSMKITHIIRGEDHISNTPKQILLAEALGIKTPKYLHLPLIFGQRGKLSKRDNVKSVLEYREDGYLPEAIINFLALLGWNPGRDKEIFSMQALTQEFSIEKLQKSGAKFNPQKLEWINGFYIRSQPLEKIAEKCIPYLIEQGLITPLIKAEQYPPAYGGDNLMQRFKINSTGEEITFEFVKRAVGLYKERMKKLSEVPELTDFLFSKELNYNRELLVWKNMKIKEVKDNLDKLYKLLQKIDINDWTKEYLRELLLKEAKEIGNGDRGKILWPMRVALTGKKASADPIDIAEVLGKEKTLKRLKQAKKLL